MKDIATFKDGSFYFVEKLDEVDEFFVEAFGGLISVIANNVKIIVKPLKTKKISDIRIF